MYNALSPLYPFMFFVGMALCITLIYNLFYSRSKAYRQDLSNMYVAGKIKQIAKKEGLDLNKEFAEFAKITKNKRIDYEALDNTVERELQEKLSEKPKEKELKSAEREIEERMRELAEE